MSEDETAIRANVAAYVEAFNRKDSKALAAFWLPEAVYISRTTGQQATGAAEIESELADEFQDGVERKLEASIDSVEMLSPNVAVERGTARILVPEESPEELAYTAIHVKRDGKWLLDRVSEEEVAAVPSHYEQLKPLEWMIGSWVDEDEGARVEMTCSWTKNQNFITRSFLVAVGDQIDLSGMQIIGWDPAAERIRSWAFDSDGGFAEGTWTNKENRWIVETAATLPDGRKSSSVNIMKIVDDNAITWQITGRDVDGEILPNLPEVKISRAPVLAPADK
jgi:uncharacterized protein (TIGR02246 family)